MAKKKRLAILTGGGDTCALNGSIETIKNMADVVGYEVFGIRQGWKGLLGDGDMINLSKLPIDGWRGGSILYSSRTNPFKVKTPNGVVDKSKEVVKNIKKYGLDLIISIGGDDTNGAAKALHSKYKIPVIGFPKTIDNDLRTRTVHKYKGKKIEAVLCPGFPTAAKVVSSITEQLRTTADTHKRVFVVEVMGRDAGWLTGASAHGGADLVLVPEIIIDKPTKTRFLSAVKKAFKASKNGGLIIGVSEGVKWYDDATGNCDTVKASVDLDAFGHPRLGGIAGTIASEITAKTGIDARSQSLGYLPRSGRATHHDRQLSTALGQKVAEMLINKEYGRMPVLKEMVDFDGLEVYSVGTMPMSGVGNKPLSIKDYYDTKNFLMKPAYFDFLKYLIGDKVEEPDLNIFKKVSAK